MHKVTFQDLKSESAFFPLKAKKLSQFLLITSNAYHHAMAHFPGDHMAQVVWIYQLWGGSYTNFFTPIDRKVGENHKKICWGLDNFFTFSISYISKKLRFDALNFLVYTVKWLNCGINAQYLDQSVHGCLCVRKYFLHSEVYLSLCITLCML